MPTVMWFRRDLRLADNPALLAAVEAARADGDGRVVPLFVVDPALWQPAGPPRREYLVRALAALGRSLDDSLVLRHGDPVHVLPEIVRAAGASSVHIAADFGPYGSRRDEAVEEALSVPLVRTGSPYAVAPGRVAKDDGTPYRVFTPFWRAWVRHGWRAPAAAPPGDADWWSAVPSEPLPTAPDSGDTNRLPAGEQQAQESWAHYRSSALGSYADERNRPDLASTSMMSHHLKWGEIHPRTLLADLGPGDEVFSKELCWREFYADVLAHNPESARESLDQRFDDDMRWTTGADAQRMLTVWREGRTGYPLVDAGMRQLRDDGWVHNRVRMVVASFLVKDLHLPWQLGAREFMTRLRDADLASNAHGWQWTAGCGTDASPFYRVFNPVLQGLKFDPAGDYVRRYVPELRHLNGAAVHEPWKSPDGYSGGYPPRVVDHATERDAALADFTAIKQSD